MALQIITQAFLLIEVVVQSIAPKYIYNKQSKNNLINGLKKISFILSGISLVFMMVGIIFIPILVSLFFGSDYTKATEIAVSMLPILLIYALDTLLMQYIYREKLVLVLIIKWSFLVLFSVIAYWFGLFVLKIQNVQVLFMINYCVALTITFILVRNKLKYE